MRLTVVCVNEQHVAFCDAASATARARAGTQGAQGRGHGTARAAPTKLGSLLSPLLLARARELALARVSSDRHLRTRGNAAASGGRGARHHTHGDTRSCLEPRTAGRHGHPRRAAQHGLRPRCFRLLLRARPRRLSHGLRNGAHKCVLGTKAAPRAFSILSSELCRFTDRLPARPVMRRGAAAPGCGCAGDAAPSLRAHRGGGAGRDITAAARREPTAGYQRRAAQLARSSARPAARARLVQRSHAKAKEARDLLVVVPAAKMVAVSERIEHRTTLAGLPGTFRDGIAPGCACTT